MSFPSNVLVLLSHWSYFIPEKFEKNINDSFLENDKRLLKNFSDWWTKFLISEEIPKNQIIQASFSRAIWDPNRARDEWDIFRDTDFWWISLWKIPLTQVDKEYLLKNYYDIHHNFVRQKIAELKKHHKNIFVIDVHDTWNLLMWETFDKDKLKQNLFPKLAICDCEWKTLWEKLPDFVEKSFLEHLDTWVVWNDPYKFSFITNNYSDIKNWVFTLQVEFGRYLLIDEKTQTYNPDVEKIKNGFFKVLCDIWNFLEK